MTFCEKKKRPRLKTHAVSSIRTVKDVVGKPGLRCRIERDIEVLDFSLKERLSHERAVDVVDGRRGRRAAQLLLDRVECGRQRRRVRDVSLDANGLAARRLDLLDNVGVVVWVPGQEDDRVGLGEFESSRTA